MVLKRIFSHYLPVCLWMILIFYFSSQQKISVSPTFILNFILFKSLHVIEYAILFALWCWAIANKKNFFTQETYLWAGITTLMYAVFDEIHQTFIPTREGTMRDVAIDGIGIIIMYMFINQKNIKQMIKKIWQ